MDPNALALLIQENSVNGAPVRQALGGEARCKLQAVERVPTALARIAGGGVDIVILDLSCSRAPEVEQLDALLKLRGAAPEIPIVVVSETGADGLVMRAIRAGTAEHIEKQRCGAGLRRLIAESLDRRSAQREPVRSPPEQKKNGTVIMLLGGKGGVGTSTVALSVASVLAKSGSVILAELAPGFGILPQYFHPHPKARNITQLLKMDPLAIGPGEAEECLWPAKSIPGLKILFGPLTAEQCREIGPGHARAIVRALEPLADFVVLDLPAALSEANREFLQDADVMVLVSERDLFSVEAGRRMLETILSWNAPAPTFGAVIVNRALLAVPPELVDIELRLAIPIFAVIPPAPDECVAAQKQGAPLALHDPSSMAALSLIALAERITVGR
jgi:Flp pilus assembly CpaE family ATPase